MQDQSSTVTYCPSFSSYSSDKIAKLIVTKEEPYADCYVEDYGDEDFEFVLVRANPDDSATTVDNNGSDDGFRPVFPLFNRDLLTDDYDVERQIQIPLKNLFISDDRDPPSSSSSSDADELEGVPVGTFCLWAPSPSRSPAASPARCQKSNSQGTSSSKRKWRLRDLLRRSGSDGKQSLVFFSPKSDKLRENVVEKVKRAPLPETKTKSKDSKAKVPAHELFYLKSKAFKEGDKRRSYLPYRRDLVGFFPNANGFGKSFVSF